MFKRFFLVLCVFVINGYSDIEWEAVQTLENTGAYSEFKMAEDGSGNAVCAWIDTSGGVGANLLKAAYSTDSGQTWGAVNTFPAGATTQNYTGLLIGISDDGSGDAIISVIDGAAPGFLFVTNTTDTGASWAAFSNPIPGGFDIINTSRIAYNGIRAGIIVVRDVAIPINEVGAAYFVKGTGWAFKSGIEIYPVAMVSPPYFFDLDILGTDVMFVIKGVGASLGEIEYSTSTDFFTSTSAPVSLSGGGCKS